MSSYNIVRSFLAILLLGCLSCRSKDIKDIVGVWIVKSATIDDKGVFPPSEKLQLEQQAKGQVWQFNPDSTVIIKRDTLDRMGNRGSFVISESNGQMLLSLSEGVVELANIKDSSMDIIMSMGVTATMHTVRQQFTH